MEALFELQLIIQFWCAVVVSIMILIVLLSFILGNKVTQETERKVYFIAKKDGDYISLLEPLAI